VCPGRFLEAIEPIFKPLQWQEEAWQENFEENTYFNLHMQESQAARLSSETPRKSLYTKRDMGEPLFHEFYISSEDDLSPVDSVEASLTPWEQDFDETLFDDDDDDDDDLASISSSQNSDVAYAVSIFSVGKPRVVDVSPRGSMRLRRSGSLQSRSGFSSFSTPSFSRGDSGDWTRASHLTTTEAIKFGGHTTIEEDFAIDTEQFYNVFGSDNNWNTQPLQYEKTPEPQTTPRISVESNRSISYQRSSHLIDSRRPSRLSITSIDSNNSRLKRQKRLSSVWFH